MNQKSKYYNSDLNEYIGKELPKIMTSIDLDLLQYKISKNIIRFAEYKHVGENVGKQQYKALKKIADIGKIINENPILFNNIKIEVCVIEGNKPFNNIKVYDYIYGTEKEYNQKEEIKNYLCLEDKSLSK